MADNRKGKKKIIIAVSAIVIILAGAVVLPVLSSGKGQSQSIIMTETVEIGRQNLVNSINVSGSVMGSNVVKITSSLSSKIESLNVSVGDYVKKGDVLCTFDSSAFQQEYDTLKSSVDMGDEMSKSTHDINQRNLQNAIAEKEISLVQAQRNIDDAVNARDKAYDKYNNLVNKYNASMAAKDELYSKIPAFDDEMYEISYQKYQEELQKFTAYETELDTLGEQLSTYDSAVQSAEDAYSAAERTADINIQTIQDTINSEKFNVNSDSKAQLEKLQEKIDSCKVVASQDGIVTALNAAEGSIPTTDAIMTIEDDSVLKISVQIKEADILNIKEGMKAVIKTNATADEEFYGTVSKVVNIFSGADVLTQSEGGYTAEITVDEKNSKLLIGMNAKVKIIIDEKDDVLAVPYDSITENDNGDDIIYIARKQSDGTYKAQSVEVEKGLESDYYTEIVSSDIKEGDILITSINGISDGQEVFVEAGELNG